MELLESPSIDLGPLYEQIVAELRALELRAAELRGQKDLIERLIQSAQRPIMSGEPIGEPNGREQHTGALV